MTKKIQLSNYAKYKFKILAQHKVLITPKQVLDTVAKPEKILTGHKGRKIAQKGWDREHLLRVIYEEEKDRIVVVTFYPVRRERYEDKL